MEDGVSLIQTVKLPYVTTCFIGLLIRIHSRGDLARHIIR